MLVVACPLLLADCDLLVGVSCFGARCLLVVVCCLLIVDSCVLFVVSCLMYVVCC